MAKRSFPFAGEFTGFDSNDMPTSDRDYSEEDLARAFRTLVNGGHGIVDNGSNPLMVMSGGGLTVRINPGMIWIKGRLGEIYSEDEALMLEPGGTLPRIDLVVARLDTSTEIREIYYTVIKGEPAAVPVAPAVRREDDGSVIIWDMVLAQVRVNAGAFGVTQGDVMDVREYAVLDLPDWSTTQKGIGRLATQEEMTAGILDNVAVTPSGLASSNYGPIITGSYTGTGSGNTVISGLPQRPKFMYISLRGTVGYGVTGTNIGFFNRERGYTINFSYSSSQSRAFDFEIQTTDNSITVITQGLSSEGLNISGRIYDYVVFC